MPSLGSSVDRAVRFGRTSVAGSTPAQGTKTCTKCAVVKDLSLFAWKSMEHGTRQSYCLGCQKIASRAHYCANKSDYLDKNKRQKASLQEWYQSLKRGKPCVDCQGVFHIQAMEYDHLPEFKKEMCVSEMVRRSCGKRRILDEIAKCELICANCHAARTASRSSNLSGGTKEPQTEP